MYMIDFAKKEEEPLLQDIFTAVDMALVGSIEDHVVIRENGILCGGGLLYEMDVQLFHLLTIAVRQDGRGRGTGSLLLRKILEQPWCCCRDAVTGRGSVYRVTTVARGSSRNFYLKNGLNDCRFDELIEPFEHQCKSCSEADQCNSSAMEYFGNGKDWDMVLGQEGEYAV